MSAAYPLLANNPLATRSDAAHLARDLFRPLVPCFSAGRARVRFSEDAGHFDRAASELEGFSRPLWAIAPLIAGGGRFDHTEYFLEGLANGSNPEHPEYWGTVGDLDQRAVEMAAIGNALTIAPEVFWDGLTGHGRDTLGRWLKGIETVTVHEDNWHFFVVLVQDGLDRVGVATDRAVREFHLKRIESYYLGDGYYGDGPEGFVDHYNGYALHCYGLLYAARHAEDDAARSARFIERARAFAQTYRYWFGDNGASIPFGRSMTYRFGMASAWAAMAVAGVDALPWGEIRGLWGRHIRYWLSQPMTDALGRLAVGYRTPNQLMAEEYNSPTSSYWAMKALLPLALPESHPFWTASEAPAPDDLPAAVAVPSAKFIVQRRRQHAVLLPGGPTVTSLRNAPDKYAKFAYSSAFGFSVESDRWLHNGWAGDNALALSPDGRHWRVREEVLEGRLEQDRLLTRWEPWEDCRIETLQLLLGEWEIRAHRIRAHRAYWSVETGFAVPGRVTALTSGEAVLIQRPAISALLDISGERVTAARPVMPNTNLLFPQAVVPALSCEIPAGETLLIAAVFADPDEPVLPRRPERSAVFSVLERAGFAVAEDRHDAMLPVD